MISLLSSSYSVLAFNDNWAKLINGIYGFLSQVSALIDAILGSAVLSICFASSFAFVAVGLVRYLKR